MASVTIGLKIVFYIQAHYQAIYCILFGMIKRARIVKPHFSYKKLTYLL